MRFICLALVLLAACGSSASDRAQYRLDRPVDLAFGCITSSTDDQGNSVPITVPLGECETPPDAGPEGFDAGQPGTLFGMAVQSTSDEVLMINLVNTDVKDSDPLTPGLSGVTVGTRPIAAATSPDGCYGVVANQGSCDLSTIDILGASTGRAGVTTRLAITTAQGPLAAAPAAMQGQPAQTTRSACTAPKGMVYLAFPGCGLVAAVDAASGQIRSSAVIPAGAGVAALGGDDVSCPLECPIAGAQAGSAAGRAQPVSLALAKDGTRLAVGSLGSSTLQLLDIDPATGLFTTATPVPIEGVTGLSKVAISGDVSMGQGGVSGVRRFVYMIGDDQAVHVADVTPLRTAMECDTQVDPRYLQDVADLTLLPCFGVGLPSTPPRRAGAQGPGIHLPGGTLPFDVAFLTGDIPINMLPGPFEMNGQFAVVTGRLASLVGAVFYINVDDDNYEDFPDPSMPGFTDPVLALPHTLRDGIQERRQPLPQDCTEDPLFGTAIAGPVRILGSPAVPSGTFDFNASIPEAEYTPGQELKEHILPLIHLERCELDQSPPDDDITDDRPVWELGTQAPPAVRVKAFPDLAAVPLERWTVAWEGRLARTAFESIHQGAVVQVVPGQLQLTVHDESNPFCDLGVLPGDRLQLVGCVADADCGLTETCFIHPESPAGLGGMCVPRDRVDEIAEDCRQLFISARTYLVARRSDAVREDQVTLVPSPAVLQSTPADGCLGVEQCNALYNDEVDQLEEATGLPQPRDQTWTCRADENLGGPARCIATCPNNSDAECPTGSVCQDLVCVEGAFPAQECLAPLQLYEARAQGAFTVVGSQSGYVHDRIVDPSTGVCIADPTASPLDIGRFTPTPPMCTSDDLVPAGPNPCSVVLDEPVAVVKADGTRVLGHRTSHGVRFRNRGIRVDFADVLTLHPRIGGPGGEPVWQANYPPGFTFTFDIGGGFTPRGDSLGPGFPARIVTAPGGGAVWIVDSGDALDSQGTLRRGVLTRLNDTGVGNALQVQ